MGKGIALEFKNRFPEMFKDYVRRCQRKEVKPGVPYLFKRLLPPNIINFPTKDHWKSVSRIDDIERGLEYLSQHYQAEVVATVIFAADALKKQKNVAPTETEVLDSVLQWKQKRRPPLDVPTVASTIRNLGMLRWLDVKPDSDLPVSAEELALA